MGNCLPSSPSCSHPPPHDQSSNPSVRKPAIGCPGRPKQRGHAPMAREGVLSSNMSVRKPTIGCQDLPKRRGHAPMARESILGRATEDVKLHYVVGKELGKGRFGLIRECTNKRTGESFACKSISKLKLTRTEDVEDVRKEIDILRDLSGHPNVLKLKDVYEDKASVHLVMELCEGGELFDRIVKWQAYPEREAALLFKTLVEVVKYCHEKGVIHRNLKPENLLLANNSSSSPIKLAGFGLALRFTPGQKCSGTTGSPYYIAPEVLNGHYSEEVDVWSTGVILYILLCGVPPFWGETDQSIFEAIKKGDIDFTSDPWGNISLAAKDLIRRILCRNPEERLKPAEILKHPWILLHTTQPEQDDGSISRQDSSQKARHCRTNDSQADFSGASPFFKQDTREVSAAPKETCLSEGRSFKHSSLATAATECLLPECFPDLQATPDFAFQNGGDATSESLSSSTCEGNAEYNVSSCSFKQQASALFSSPSSSSLSELPSPDSFDRWASVSQVTEPTFRKFLAASVSSCAASQISLFGGYSQVQEQEKATVMVDSPEEKIVVVHDRSRRRIGWKVAKLVIQKIPSILRSEACSTALFPSSSSIKNSHSFNKFKWPYEVAAFALALPFSHAPNKTFSQALYIHELPICI